MLRYLARTPVRARRRAVSRTWRGELNQAEHAGHADQGHPNWRRRLATRSRHLAAPGGELAQARRRDGGGRPRHAPERQRARRAAAARHLPAAVPQGLHLRRRGSDRALSGAARRSAMSTPRRSTGRGRARPTATTSSTIAAINPELGGEDGVPPPVGRAAAARPRPRARHRAEPHGRRRRRQRLVALGARMGRAVARSRRAFDIDWERLGANRKLVVPFLGDRYGDALEKGELKLAFDAARGRVQRLALGAPLPDLPPELSDRPRPGAGRARAERGDGHRPRSSPSASACAPWTTRRARSGAPASPRKREGLKARLAGPRPASPAPARGDRARRRARQRHARHCPKASGRCTASSRRKPTGSPIGGSRRATSTIAASSTSTASPGCASRIPTFSRAAHDLVFRLVREGRVQGLRIDHIDGLADPEGYARALQGRSGPGFYVVVEKILEPGERLRPWPVAGTTGYDVLNLIDGVFVDSRRPMRFERLYRRPRDCEGAYGGSCCGGQDRDPRDELRERARGAGLGPEAHRRYRPAHPRLHRQRAPARARRDRRPLSGLPQLSRRRGARPRGPRA